MTRRFAWLALAFLAIVLPACRRPRTPPPPPPPPPQTLVVLLPDAPGRAGIVSFTNAGGSQELTIPNTAVRVLNNLTGPLPPGPIDEATVRQIFGAALDALPPEELAFNLYFTLGTTSLAPASEATLPLLLQAVRDRRSTLLTVTGHTDTTGTSREANYRLGMERAESLAQRLREIGVDPKALVIRSHGQEDPLVATPPNTDEPRNRRVEVIVR